MALAHFQRTFTDASGNVKPGLSVTVRRESDNGLAALFADAGSVTPKSNPFNTDANGHGSFYVVDGRYRIQATDIDWRNEDLISQPSPNFSAMPQVGGDPIVESGSNADGEWTKFSDGTLFLSSSVTGNTFIDSVQMDGVGTLPVAVTSIINARLFGELDNITLSKKITLIRLPLTGTSTIALRVYSANGDFVSGDETDAVINVFTFAKWQ